MRNEQLNHQQFEPLNFADLFRVITLNFWQIVGLTGAVMAATLLYAYSLEPKYRSVATVLLEPRLNRAVQIREVYDPGIGTDDYQATQVEVMRSRLLAERVVERLKLDEKLAAKPLPEPSKLNLRRWLPSFLADRLPLQEESAPERTPEYWKHAAIRKVVANTIVLPVPRTQLLAVGYSSESREEAALIANTLTEVYIESGLESRLEASRRATKWLTEKLGELRGNLEAAEKNLQAYREREQLVSVGGTRGLVEEEMLDSARRLREAQKTTGQLGLTYRQIQQAAGNPDKLEQVGDLIRLPLVQSAKAGVVSAEEAFKQLQQRYGEKHPLIAGAQTRLQSAEKTFRDQLLLAAENFRNEYEAARQNEMAYSSSSVAARERIRNLDRKQYEFGVLQREVTSNEQLYNLFLNSFKEADSSSSYEPINARVIQSAEPATDPFDPDYRGLLLRAFFAGILLSLLLIIARQMLDESVRSADELESMTDLSVMGVLPRVAAFGGRKKNIINYFSTDSRTPYAEGIRSVRASVQLNDIDKRYRKIMVTSTVPGEGKSSLAACLAMAFAANEKVLLVEGDMRAPTLKKVFNISKTRPGIMEVLSGEIKFDDAVYIHEPSKLAVLPVARRPANPAEVISSGIFAQLMQSVASTYDRIIIDSPPLQAASDSLMLAKVADAVIFTVKADDTRRRAVLNAVKQLRNIQASPLGAVINQVNARRNPSYYDNYYAKGYYG